MITSKNEEILNFEEVEDTKESENAFKKETFDQRGIFEANGYKFTVYPILCKEVSEYINDKVMIPKQFDENGNKISDKDLGKFLISCFSTVSDDKNNQGSINNVNRKSVFKTRNNKNDVDYSKYKYAYGFVKWIEKKVYYNGKPVKFEDLEMKYSLTKSEIAKLIIYLSDFSGF